MGYYQRIKDLRDDADKKQSEIAQALFMQTVQYGRYERGERELPFNIAINIAKHYSVSLDYLAGITNSPAVYGDNLSQQERRFIEEFRKLDDFEKGQIFEKINNLIDSHNKK